MINKVNYFIGFCSYIMAIILVIYYLILEFSIITLTSPLDRIKIVMLTVLLMYIGLIFLKKTGNEMFNKLPKYNLIIWFVLYLTMILNLTLFDKYFGRTSVVNSITDILDYQRMKNDFFKTQWKYRF